MRGGVQVTDTEPVKTSPVSRSPPSPPGPDGPTARCPGPTGSTKPSPGCLTPELKVLHLERSSPHEKPMLALLPGEQSGLSEKAATALTSAWLWLLLRRRRASWEGPPGSLGVPSMPREPAPPRSPQLRMLSSFGVGLFREKTKSPLSLLFQAQRPRCVDCTPFIWGDCELGWGEAKCEATEAGSVHSDLSEPPWSLG